MRRLLGLASLIVFISGCQSAGLRINQYRLSLEEYKGNSPDEIANDFGVPDKTITLSDSTEAWVYYKNYGSSSNSQIVFNTAIVNTHNHYCETTFFFKDKKVEQVKAKGNRCG